MKKIIYSVLITSTLIIALSATALAATNSLVGKKIQSTIMVELDGKQIKDGIVVDGVSYAPVRSLSDASGYTLTLKGGKVSMTSTSIPTVTQLTDASDPSVNMKISARIQVLKNEIETNKVNIQITETEAIAVLKRKIAEQRAFTVDIEAHQSMADAGQKNLDEYLAYVAELQAKIAAAEAEISQLEATLK